MNVLGISCFYHDAAAALVVDGALVACAEEERFSRVKHDHEFPQRAIDFCLRTAGLAIGDLDLVVFYEKPFWKLDRIIMSALQTFPRSVTAFREGLLVWLLDKLWVRDVIMERLGIARAKIAFSAHHLSHAASAYYSSGFDKSAILTIDGVGEWATGTRGVAWDQIIELQDKTSYPHSVGLLYSAFTAFLGFQVNEGEYKVMGMAPYGQPRYVDLIFEKLVKLEEDGAIWLDMDYFAFHHSASHSFSQRFVDLFGEPRTPEESNLLDARSADIAASIQKVTEEIVLRQARALFHRTGHENLCLAGGVALNSVANARVLRESGFRRLFVQPAAGDGGGALGAALYGAYTVLGETRRFRMTHAYWGEAHDDAAIADWLRAQGHDFRELPDEDAICDETAERLMHGQVVGWMQGRFEWGPRALGHRSILADPRTAVMKDVVNARIKFREPFRPFAPSVLAERVEDLFDLPDAASVDPARYMLLVLPVRESARDHLQAVTHVDGSARIQAVHADASPRYHHLIRTFGERSGVPVVLNTSFNLRGEPIVNTPAEAFSTFARSDMDALVMGRFVVSRRGIRDTRVTREEDLEAWRHAPTPAPLPEIPDPQARARATSLQPLPDARPAPSRRRRGTGTFEKMKAAFLTTVGLLIVTLVLLEMLMTRLLPMPNLQLGGMYRAEGDTVGLNPGWSRQVRGSEFNVPIRIGPDGLRDGPPPNVPAHEAARPLLVVGDSFTFGCWSTPEKRFTGVLQTALGPSARVISGGSPNFGTDAEAALLRARLPALKPYGVVLAFYCGNDYWDNFVGASAYVVNHGVLEMRDPWWSREMAFDAVAAGKGRENLPLPEPGPSRPATGPLPSPWAPDPLSAAAGIERPPFLSSMASWLRHTEIYQAGAGLHMALTTPSRFVRPFEAQAWMLRGYPPEMQQAVEMTYRYLDAVLAVCEDRNIPLALVVIPSRPEVDDAAWAAWMKQNGFTPEDEALFDREKPRRIVLRWASARGVPALDLAPSFVNRKGLYYDRDMHWTDLGHFQAGERLAELVRLMRWKP